MKFFTVAPVLAAVAFSAMSVVAQGASAIVSGINQVTQLSANARDVTNSITITTAATEFPVLVNDFNVIINTVSGLAQTLQEAEGNPLDDNDAQLVVDALTTFVNVHKALLDAVIGKHSLAAQFFFTAPIAAALRSLEAIIDAFATALIALIPTQAPQANAQFTSLSDTLNLAITTYSS
ncbi:hypothetical protein ACG7TL_002365 [Trametes sanguinea]